MLSPLCVSHSRQAETHERQPMQREGSRKILLTVSTIRFLPSIFRDETRCMCVRADKSAVGTINRPLQLSQRWIWLSLRYRQFMTPLSRSYQGGYIFVPGPARFLIRRGSYRRAHFIFRNLVHWLQNRIGQLVGGLGVSVMIGNKEGVWTDRAHDKGGNGHLATARTHRHPVTIFNTQPVGCLLVHLNPRIGSLFIEERNTACLVA